MLAALLLAAADPVPPTPAAERSAVAAVKVVRAYYAAVSRHDYRAAHAIWSGERGVAALARGYARTARVAVTPIPPFTTDPGCGQVYSEVKVEVNAVLRDGTRQRFRGSYVLHRVNDIDGSTASQRRWHIASAHLREVPAGG